VVEVKIGDVYGRLTVVAREENDDRQLTRWTCRCSCDGKLVVKHGFALRRKVKPTRSCGCLRAYTAILNNHKKPGHRAIHTPEYWAFKAAFGRCTNKNNRSYPHYGGRGIEFRFACFEDFLRDVGYRPSPKHSLDRIDNNGHYEAGNMRWATKAEQAKNRRRPFDPDRIQDDLNRLLVDYALVASAQLVNLTNAVQ
jgi:hypothetical protein